MPHLRCARRIDCLGCLTGDTAAVCSAVRRLQVRCSFVQLKVSTQLVAFLSHLRFKHLLASTNLLLLSLYTFLLKTVHTLTHRAQRHSNNYEEEEDFRERERKRNYYTRKLTNCNFYLLNEERGDSPIPPLPTIQKKEVEASNHQ